MDSVLTTLDVATGVYWSAIGMLIAGLATFLATSVFTAPYGKHTKGGWGPLIPARVAWILMETPNLWTTAFFAYVAYAHIDAVSNESRNIRSHLGDVPNMILLGLFLLHYINRSIVYPLKMTQATPMPASVMFMAFCFCTWNGAQQSANLILVKSYPIDWLYNSQFIAGVLIFFVGLTINIQSDNALLAMRERLRVEAAQAGKNVKTKYGIPTGGMFDYVSSANLFGEIVEWWGFALAGNSLTALSFAVYTMVFLTVRGLQNHKWYLEKFDDYPPQRKGVYPFLL